MSHSISVSSKIFSFPKAIPLYYPHCLLLTFRLTSRDVFLKSTFTEPQSSHNVSICCGRYQPRS